ncbi:CocE/NonD family hydrolase [Photobacterium minamisatsumaniensis]|uniref:CocE/NonD family hydrolase n=1 Tax=Photobacterium minamisatsumaniensis TaxID=2910233 RepID=UPI003D136C15
MKVLKDNMVATRDGVLLATDVYLPQNFDCSMEAGSLHQSWPVIIERTPYNKAAPSRSEVDLSGHLLTREEMARAFTDAGFVCVFQDCRGRYKSTGTFTKYINEAEDGFDTCEWIHQQPWCNGSIGSMGLSYAAHTQMAMACLNPPGLACMALDSGGFSSAYECGIRQGGAFELKQATWAYRQALVSPEAKADPIVKRALESEDIIEWFKQMPWKRGHSPLRHLPDYEAYLLEQWEAGTFDDFWKGSGIYTLDSYQHIPDIPILLMSSWYDVYVKSTLDNYRALSEQNTAPVSLIMGPWLHGDRNVTHCGDVEFGAQASFDTNVAQSWLQQRIDWFRRWLLDANLPEQAKVSVFQMGGGDGSKTSQGKLNHGGRWIHTTQWPLPHTQMKQWYLRSGGELSHEPEITPACLSYLFDPRHPMPTIGGALTSGKPVFVGGAFDQTEDPRFFGTNGNNLPLSARKDVLVFETPVLTQDLIVSGKVMIKLFIESDALDTDFTAKLVDVYPPNDDYPQGFAMNISDGIFRCRYHHSYQKPQLLQQGKVYEIEIEAFATCNVFKRGHRMRLDISSSNFPKFDVNPNSGEPEGSAQLMTVAKNTIHFSSALSSSLMLEVIEN